MRTDEFFFDLPESFIAQSPLPHRDRSRLLVVDRRSGGLAHTHFNCLAEFLRAGDLLVVNDSKVIRARLRAVKVGSGGKIEVMLLRSIRTNEWWAMLKPGKRVRAGTKLTLLDRAGQITKIEVLVAEVDGQGQYRVRFEGSGDVLETLDSIGEIPLPPYIRRPAENLECDDAARYQTVFARSRGSVAAPTAGLHLTEALLDRIRRAGIGVGEITLHVGPGTFAPVKSVRIEDHSMHAEDFSIDETTATAVNKTKAQGGRVIAVGTTTVRTLESAVRSGGQTLQPMQGSTNIFIYPPFEFKVVDALVTNFHLPESTLLMLVSAFAAPGSTEGRELILRAYQEAIRERYRFFSYGDAMLVL